MDLHLADRIAFVAGSSRGIGRAIAAVLLREGCRVCITGRELVSLDLANQQLGTEYGDKLIAIPGDLTEANAIDCALDVLKQKWGDPDILVANLGTGKGKPGWRLDQEEWLRLFNHNFFGSVRLAQSAIPRMRERGGTILFVTSIAAVETTPAPLPYSAAKAALVNYSKNLSRTLAADKIRVNCIAPGNVIFPGGSWERHLSNRREEVEQYIASEVPQKRFGTPEEVAELAGFLVSPVSSFATGGCYIIDGGQTRRT